MILGYSFQLIDNENVLVIHLCNNNEFSNDFKNNVKDSNIKNNIKDYVKRNKISFNGKKIAISIGGIILAMLLLVDSPSIENDYNLSYVDNVILQHEVYVDNSNGIVEEDLIVTPDNKIDEEIIKDNINNNFHSNQNSVNVNKPNNSIESNNNVNNNISSDNDVVINDKNEDSSITDIQQMVTIYRSNGSVINISFDEYLIGVVSAEMPASFNIEALKAQAVVSRTYALKKIALGEKLTDTVATQRYMDNNELKKQWSSGFNTYYNKIKKAVEETKDLAIYYNGDYIDAVFHSTSNGKTEDSFYVWGNSLPYLKSVDSSWDRDASTFNREISKDFTIVLSLLGINNSETMDFEILSRDDSGRVIEVRFGDSVFTGVQFRSLLGLRSTDFDLVLKDGVLSITTRGYGHGVGMSQYGANGMAKSGYNYKEIINHYYTGVDIY